MGKDAKKKAGTAIAKPAAKKKSVKLTKAKAVKAIKALPLPAGVPAAKAKAPKAVRKAEARHLQPLAVPVSGKETILQGLWDTIQARKASGDVSNSHSARLLARGTPKVAQKLGEEAVELVIEAVQGNRRETVMESADLLYHLLVVWVDAGIEPSEVWAELERRQGISGIAEKAARPKGIIQAAQTTKLP
ncbi:phosphoribosyl-ATP diphosphatase [Acetobacteraceae bacterium H6797]|nr:phosphoribosyl-ATP diphosphatase [Acetobacteraceae bacterium H6797]